MATAYKVSSSIPSNQRTALITAVAAGDQVDVTAILGRPAKGVKFTMTDEEDIMVYKLNNLVKLQKERDSGGESIDIWLAGTSEFTASGSLEYVTAEGLSVGSFEIVSLTLGTGTTIEVVVW